MASSHPRISPNNVSRKQDGPALSIAAAAVSVIGLICGFCVSWMASIAAGVIAVVLGIAAHRKQAAMPWLAKVGIALGIICIVASFVLVAIVSYQLINMGLA